MRRLALVGLVALSVVGGPAGALAAVPDERTPERQDRIDRSARPEPAPKPVPGPRPSALPRSAPAGDLRGNAVATAAAVLLALVWLPVWRRRHGR
jgi:hypothetical protein